MIPCIGQLKGGDDIKDVVMVLRVTSIIEELACSEGSLLFPLGESIGRPTIRKDILLKGN